MVAPLSRHYRAPSLTLRSRTFAWGQRTYVMGIINVTPDSFSGDGLGTDPEAAAHRARAMEAAGADILDLGGESSRPGASELDPAEEARRVLPALEAVRAATTLPISVDTYHASVADSALRAGADAVNDIWGLRFDADMPSVVARHGAALIAMHNQRGRPFTDVVADISSGFNETLRLCSDAGIPRERVILDPGFGFGWTPEQNLEMIRRLPEFWSFQLPFLLGTSRKSTLGLVLDAPPERRFEGTAATVALSIAGGADFVRVHEVAEVARVVRVSDAVVRANWKAPTP